MALEGHGSVMLSRLLCTCSQMDLLARRTGNADLLVGAFWRHADLYVGATRATHNTAEMQGLLEALLWVISWVEQEVLQIQSSVMITVDSLHVRGLVEGTFVTPGPRG